MKERLQDWLGLSVGTIFDWRGKSLFREAGMTNGYPTECLATCSDEKNYWIKLLLVLRFNALLRKIIYNASLTDFS